MHSKEDEAYVIYKDGNKDDIYKVITVSFDKIADILTKMNQQITEKGGKKNEN